MGDPLFADTRALILTCKFVNLPYKVIEINTLEGQHRTKQFKEAYPCGYMPILIDG